MSQLSNLESLPHADRVALAIQAIKSNALLSQQRTAATYNVPKTTLQRQRVKPASTRVIHHNASKL
jgi:DNA-binding transcriptional regulator YiaG